jgi:hypothetical protein
MYLPRVFCIFERRIGVTVMVPDGNWFAWYLPLDPGDYLSEVDRERVQCFWRLLKLSMCKKETIIFMNTIPIKNRITSASAKH